MSARISLHCDSADRYGICATQLLTDAHTLDEARTTARAHGWRTTSSGDYCPACSGHGRQPATAVVAVLHPRT